MTHKNVFFISRKAPYGSSAAADMAEAALIAAAFDQVVHLVFLDDGIFQLTRAQSPTAIGHRDHANVFLDLADYDIDEVWVEAESLAERGLCGSDLMIEADILDRATLADRLAQADMLVSF